MSWSRDQDRGAERGDLGGVARRGTNATATASADRGQLHDRQQSVQAGVLAPDAERRLARELEADRLAPEDAEAALRRDERQHERDARPPRTPTLNSSHDRARDSPRPVANSGASASGANLAAAASASQRAARRRRELIASSANTTQHRDQRVVGVAHQREERVRVGHPSVGEREPEHPARRARAAGARRAGTGRATVSRSKASVAARAAGSS